MLTKLKIVFLKLWKQRTVWRQDKLIIVFWYNDYFEFEHQRTYNFNLIMDVLFTCAVKLNLGEECLGIA